MIYVCNLRQKALDNSLAAFDFKDCLFRSSDEKCDYPNLKKWVRYRAVDYGDADQILKTPENRAVLRKIGWDNTKWIDCIFSMKTYFGAFLRLYFGGKIPYYYGEILDRFDEIFGARAIADFACQNAFDADLLYETFAEIDRFARNTHTIGNHMPCPDGQYNAAKGFGAGNRVFHDRPEFLYRALSDADMTVIDAGTKRKWKEWFDQNADALLLGEIIPGKELLSYEGPPFHMKTEKDVSDYLAYLKSVNEIIEKRSLELSERIKKA